MSHTHLSRTPQVTTISRTHTTPQQRLAMVLSAALLRCVYVYVYVYVCIYATNSIDSSQHHKSTSHYNITNTHIWVTNSTRELKITNSIEASQHHKFTNHYSIANLHIYVTNSIRQLKIMNSIEASQQIHKSLQCHEPRSCVGSWYCSDLWICQLTPGVGHHAGKNQVAAGEPQI